MVLVFRSCHVLVMIFKIMIHPDKEIYLYFSDSPTSQQITMALMKAAQAWERFVLKDLTTFGRYARVELTPPGPGDLVGAVKGVGGLAKDALTFKWAQV